MPFDCQHRVRFGPDACLSHCPASAPGGCFSVVRVTSPGDLPPADLRVVDIAVLDMHHGWPNLGHDAIVHAIQNAVCDIQEALGTVGFSVRALSYDVRRGHQIPEPPGGRHLLYVGTGGPGHLDPAMNDGEAPYSQGIREDPRWEPRLFALFDRILAEPAAVLLGVCHTFGVMCRWLAIAEAELRADEKGGKSAGIVESVLAPEAASHPWFARLLAELPHPPRLRVLDSRLFDLVPRAGAWTRAGIVPLGYEAARPGEPGPALTMFEAARDEGGTMPRVLGVNHHPEIVNRRRQLTILQQKMDRSEVSAEWFAERARSLTETLGDEPAEYLLHLASSYTFLAPLRYHLYRVARLAVEAAGGAAGFHEEAMPLAVSAPGVSAAG